MDFMGWLSAVVVAGVCAAYSRYYLHMLQLESYQLDGYRRWLDKNRDQLMGATQVIGVLAAIGVLLVVLGGWSLRRSLARSV